MVSACIFDVDNVIVEAGRLPALPGAMTEEEEAKYLGEINQLLPDDLRDGVFIFIKELKNKGLNLGAVSCYPHLRTLLNRLQLRHYFHAFSKQGSDAPSPEMYMEIAEDMGVSPENTIVFTASKSGIEAATRAGCWVIGVGAGGELSEADLVLPSLERVRFLKIIAAIGEEEE